MTITKKIAPQAKQMKLWGGLASKKGMDNLEVWDAFKESICFIMAMIVPLGLLYQP